MGVELYGATRRPVNSAAGRVGRLELVAAAMFALWWLIITSNSEGDPGDPELLPLFAGIPLGIGIYRVLHGRSRMHPHA